MPQYITPRLPLGQLLEGAELAFRDFHADVVKKFVAHAPTSHGQKKGGELEAPTPV
jgi:hypothetical protein